MKMEPMIKNSEMPDEPHEHQIKDWADTLMNAEEIKADPHKMKHVKLHLAKKMKAIRSLDDLRSLAKAKSKEAKEENEEEL